MYVFPLLSLSLSPLSLSPLSLIHSLTLLYLSISLIESTMSKTDFGALAPKLVSQGAAYPHPIMNPLEETGGIPVHLFRQQEKRAFFRRFRKAREASRFEEERGKCLGKNWEKQERRGGRVVEVSTTGGVVVRA